MFRSEAVCLVHLYINKTDVYIMHSWVRASDFKVEVALPRPGDPFVPPTCPPHWIRIASKPSEVRQTNPRNRAYLRCSSWGPGGSSRLRGGAGDLRRTPVGATWDDCRALIRRIGLSPLFSLPSPGTPRSRRRPIRGDEATPASQAFRTQNWVRRSKLFCRWFCSLLGQAECISVAAWTRWKSASYYLVSSGSLIVCC